jgi:hypothetical protein
METGTTSCTEYDAAMKPRPSFVFKVPWPKVAPD